MDNSHYSKRKRSNDDDDPDGKKSRNRESARKCREKKVKETEDLKKANQNLEEKNRELKSKKLQLEEKLRECIIEIQRHKKSGCCLPDNVVSILESSEDFCAVGVRHIPRQNNVENHADILFQNDLDSDCEIPAKETHPVMKGLFTGQQLPVSLPQKNKTRYPLSRSPSKSPSPALSIPANSVARPQSSWTPLHQQTFNDRTSSPELSPLQTVPNIESDWGSRDFPKQSGFPDIEEAVEYAQKDPGVVEDGVYHFHPHQLHQKTSESGRPSLNSFGFSPNLATTSSSSSQNSPLSDSLRPSTSSSMTVSMHHTAELLSQAITNNFDASEISEDLKKQLVQLAKNQDNRITEQPQLIPVCNVLNEQNFGEVSNEVQYQTTDMPQMEVSLGSNSDMAYESLLSLAKDQQTITVLFQGKEYPCTYQQVEQLVLYMRSQKNVDNANQQLGNYFLESPVAQEMVTSDVLNQANDATYMTQNQLCTFAINDNIVNNADVVSIESPPPVVEAPVQETHLPTTVLSMIEEDSQQSQPQSAAMLYNEGFIESVDYSENVRDLPSLSLTEDHTNIFEKKPRNMQ